MALIGLAQERGAERSPTSSISQQRARGASTATLLAFGAPTRPGVYSSATRTIRCSTSAERETCAPGSARTSAPSGSGRPSRPRSARSTGSSGASRLGAGGRARGAAADPRAAAARERTRRATRPLRLPPPPRRRVVARRSRPARADHEPQTRAARGARLQSVEWETLDDAVPKLRASLKRLARDLRFEDAARLRDRLEALEERRRASSSACDRLRERPSASSHRGGGGAARLSGSRRGGSSTRGRFTGTSGLEWQAGLAAVERAEPTLAPEAADDLLLASFIRRPPPELEVIPLAQLQRGAAAVVGHVGEGWRKLVVDGIAATPVDLKRGPAVKLVDGPRTETVQAPSGRRGSTRCSPSARNVHLLAPDGDCTRGGRRKALARLARQAVVDDARRGCARPRAAACAAGRPPALPRDGISRDKERQVQHYVELLRLAAAVGARDDPRRRRGLRQGVHEPRARRLRPRGRHACRLVGSTRTRT